MDYDISIIGGGPAGAMAAQAAVGRGARTILIDDKHPGIPWIPACAEALGDVVLRTLGLPEKYQWVDNRCHKIRIVAPNGMERTLKPKGLTALVLNRPRFEADLIAQAVSKGCDYLYAHHVLKISDFGPDYRTIQIRNLQTHEGLEVKAKVVIDCSGMSGVIAKQAGLHLPLKASDVGVCSQYRVRSPDLDDDTFELWFGARFGAPKGYYWVFPKKEYANVGIGIQGGQGINTKKALEGFISNRFGDFEAFDYTNACLPLARPLHRISTDFGVMVAGDAARFCLATTGAGIGMALWSGRVAGAVAASHIEYEDPLELYDIACQKEIIPKLERAYRLKEHVTKSNESMQRYFYALLPLFWLHKIAPRWVEKRAARNMRFA